MEKRPKKRVEKRKEEQRAIVYAAELCVVMADVFAQAGIRHVIELSLFPSAT